MFSSGKSVAAIVTSLMVDRGHISYDEKVVKYWQEFGQNGKEHITVADVLRHEAGLSHVKQAISCYDALRGNIKDNAIGKMIEKQKPYYPQNIVSDNGTTTKREYHAVSRGWILNEIVRRVDPRKRTIGEILQEDVDIEGIHCGLSDEDFKNTAGNLG